MPGTVHAGEGYPAAVPLHVAIVSDRAEALWIDVAGSRADLMVRLAGFLLPRVDWQLWEGDRRQFLRLLEQGQEERAVELYFAAVGERWDTERLDVVTRFVDAAESQPRERRVDGTG